MSPLNYNVLFLCDDPAEVGHLKNCFELSLPESQLQLVNTEREARQTLKSQNFDIFIIFGSKSPGHSSDFCQDIVNDHEKLPLVWLASELDPEALVDVLNDGISTVLYQSEYGPASLLGSIVSAVEIKRKSLLRDHLDKQLSRHDELTGLLNLNSFLWELQELLATNKSTQPQSEISEPNLAILRVDVDRHDTLLSSLGRGVFDLLLVSIAARIPEILTGDYQLARVRDSSFVIMLKAAEGLHLTIEQLDNTASLLMSGLAESFDLVVEETFISVTIGISTPNSNTDNAEEFVSMAEQALNHAKEQGGTCIHHFDNALYQQTVERLHLARDLHYALERNELHLYFQPLVNVVTGQVDGAEALLRWIKSDGEFISPEVTISIAEETNLIGVIGNWILKTACETAVRIQRNNNSDFSISVNISTKQLMSQNFFDSVVGILNETGLQAKYLTLEIVETVLMTDIESNRVLLEKLSSIGVSISIDDFGTGYSSLQYLSQLPVNELKIDRSFINKILENESDMTIVQVIINLAKNLGMHIVSEGVETESQWHALQGNLATTDRCQGFLFGKPVPETDFVALPFQSSLGQR